jgi:hypothetical protein
MDDPLIITNGKFSISIETKKSPKNVNFGAGSITLRPGKPKEATQWYDVNNRQVYKRPSGHWSYTNPEQSKKSLERRMSSAYDRNVESSSAQKPPAQGTKTSAHTLSENLIKDLLLTKNDSSKVKLKGIFESEINKLESDDKTKKDWIDSTYNSAQAIQAYLDNSGEQIKNIDYVGNKAQSEEFYTADIIIQTDKRKLGVSLKKTGNARMYNTSINKDNRVQEFFAAQDDLLKRFAPQGTKLNRKLRKEIFSNNKNQKIDGLTLEKHLSNLRVDLQKNLKDDIDNVLGSSNIVGKVQKIFNAINKNTLILVSNKDVIDSSNLKKLGQNHLEPRHANDGSNFIYYGNTAVARLGIRQDGMGYGTSIKLEANFTQQFIRELTKNTND